MLEDVKAEATILREIAAAYPTVSAIGVKDALGAINGIFEKVMRAVRIAGSVTLVMGALVVAGALLAAQRRVYEAVVLHTLGAASTGSPWHMSWNISCSPRACRSPQQAWD